MLLIQLAEYQQQNYSKTGNSMNNDDRFINLGRFIQEAIKVQWTSVTLSASYGDDVITYEGSYKDDKNSLHSFTIPKQFTIDFFETLEDIRSSISKTAGSAPVSIVFALNKNGKFSLDVSYR
jgi:hypothetical protein